MLDNEKRKYAQLEANYNQLVDQIKLVKAVLGTQNGDVVYKNVADRDKLVSLLEMYQKSY
jgi:hypothetical protein